MKIFGLVIQTQRQHDEEVYQSWEQGWIDGHKKALQLQKKAYVKFDKETKLNPVHLKYDVHPELMKMINADPFKDISTDYNDASKDKDQDTYD